MGRVLLLQFKGLLIIRTIRLARNINVLLWRNVSPGTQPTLFHNHKQMRVRSSCLFIWWYFILTLQMPPSLIKVLSLFPHISSSDTRRAACVLLGLLANAPSAVHISGVMWWLLADVCRRWWMTLDTAFMHHPPPPLDLNTRSFSSPFPTKIRSRHGSIDRESMEVWQISGKDTEINGLLSGRVDFFISFLLRNIPLLSYKEAHQGHKTFDSMYFYSRVEVTQFT